MASRPPNNPGPRHQAPGTQAPGTRHQGTRAPGPTPHAPMQAPMRAPSPLRKRKQPGDGSGEYEAVCFPREAIPTRTWRVYVDGPSSTFLLYEAPVKDGRKVQKVVSAVVDESDDETPDRTVVSVRFDTCAGVKDEMKKEWNKETLIEEPIPRWKNGKPLSPTMKEPVDCSNGWHTCGADRNSCTNPYCVRRRGYARHAGRCIEEYAHSVRVHHVVKLERDRLSVKLEQEQERAEKAEKERKMIEEQIRTAKADGNHEDAKQKIRNWELANGKVWGDEAKDGVCERVSEGYHCITTQRSTTRGVVIQ